MNDRDLGIEPGTASTNFTGFRLGVNAALPSWFPFEMFNGVRNVGARTVDAGLLERIVQDAPCRPNERVSGEVFIVAGLLADKHHLGHRGAFAENRLRRVSP